MVCFGSLIPSSKITFMPKMKADKPSLRKNIRLSLVLSELQQFLHLQFTWVTAATNQYQRIRSLRVDELKNSSFKYASHT